LIYNPQPEFRPAIDEMDRRISQRFSARLQATYLGGSIPFGEAWPGASDVDCFFFTAEAPTADDEQWCRSTARELHAQFPVAAEFHVNHHGLARLETEEFWRFILRYNSVRLRGRDVLEELATRGFPTPQPTREWARGRLEFVRTCLKEAVAGRCPPSLERRVDDPFLWTRKLVRNFIVVEGGFLLMALDELETFGQGEVIGKLSRRCPKWTQLF